MAQFTGLASSLLFISSVEITTQLPLTTTAATSIGTAWEAAISKKDTFLSKLQNDHEKHRQNNELDIEKIKSHVEDLRVEMLSISHRASDAFSHYCKDRQVQKDMSSLKISTCREYGASLESLPGMPLPNVSDVTVDAEADISTKLRVILNFVQLRIRDHKVVLANVSAVELDYNCRMYDRLGMSCPYRETGLTAQKCRQISGHSDSLFYCTTQELLSLVTSQITSHVMNTQVTMDQLNVAIDPWRPPVVKTATEVASILTEKRYGVSALFRVHQVAIMLKDKLQYLKDIL